MSSNRQKSFIATLELDNDHVELLGNLHDGPILRTDSLYSGGSFTGRTQRIDDAHLLGICPPQESAAIAPLTLYFRCTDDYYTLYIRSENGHHGKCISRDSFGALGAFPAAGRDTSSFCILNPDNRIITLDDMRGDIHRVRLMADNAGQIGGVFRRGAPFTYLADTKGNGLVFKLRITQRNAPYLSDPDEI
ncbi:hypothetical protein [Pseudomonas sp. NPDC089569]|uniref:hypothetical protein n=1 Tax=Pseudomonas sp. NPDC089569 TaxID=3390722 RepID=UPI003D09116D